MFIVGTAGHVDHGKTSLIYRLTGTNTDRLPEEKNRKLTIDLGFASMSVGEFSIGFVDVPGHQDFIENMLAGVGGINGVLLVVAADEGVMPQTREHVAIIDMLQVDVGLVAITKVDLIDDEAWLKLIREDVRELLATTKIAHAPMLEVSATSGTGVAELRAELQALAESYSSLPNIERPFLSVDRSFSVTGFGTVITGTLVDGSLERGQTVEVLPRGQQARIRGLQVFDEDVAVAPPGVRVAVNLAGVKTEEVQRGDVLVAPGTLRATQLSDVYYTHWMEADISLKHNDEVKVFLGAEKTVARVRLLNRETIDPGETGWLQLLANEPMVAKAGQRLIVRRTSPPGLLGGGVVVDPHPARRYKRFKADVIERLSLLKEGTAEEQIFVLTSDGAIELNDLWQRMALSLNSLRSLLAKLEQDGVVFRLPNGHILSRGFAEQHIGRLTELLADFHSQNPLLPGIEVSDAANRLHLRADELKVFALVADDAVIDADHAMVRLSDHVVALDKTQQATAEAIIQSLEADRFRPPTLSELVERHDPRIVRLLIGRGDIEKVGDDVVFSAAAYRELEGIVTEILDSEQPLTVQSLRDRVGSSRKYILAYLDHLERKGITKRVGDVHVRWDH